MTPEGLWIGALCVATLVGALVGSFLNVVAWRLPRGGSVVWPPSACPRCGHGVRPQHNVPVLGWLILRGRCHDCASPISGRYPLVEAGCAALWAVLFAALLPGPDALLDGRLLVAFGLYASYFSALLAISLVDADHFIVPDVISLPLVPLGIAAVAVLDRDGAFAVHLPEAVLGAALGFGVMWGIAEVGRLAFGKEAMGMGDVKLMAAVGAWQGAWPTLLLTIFAASLIGSVVGITGMLLSGGRKPPRIPFGPYLCGGALVSWLFGDAILARWLI